MACTMCVLPSPESPYIYRGLKGLLPGFTATDMPAERARRLHSPSMKVANVSPGFSCGSMIIFLSPGITKGFFIFAVLVCVLKREMAVVGAVERQRYDRLEPLHELLFGGLCLDPVKAVLPHIAICLRVV